MEIDDPIGPDATPGEVRHALREWLEDAWDPGLALFGWRRRLVEARWAVPSWPASHLGRGLPAWSEVILAEELRRAGAVGLPVGAGAQLAAPTLIAHGSDDLCERHLAPILTGETTWCQLFSEPGAGSDLAGLTTRAELDGDIWRITGQKVWNTSAHHADFGILIARTDWGATKHHGLTYFVLPMDQDAIEVRPLAQMNHHASFNEVFMDGARIPTDHVVGEPGRGWTVALTTLSHERRFGGRTAPALPDGTGRAIDEARREADLHYKTYEWYPQRRGRPDLAVEHARQRGSTVDPLVRQRLAELVTLQRVSEWTAQRARDNRSVGRPPGPEGSLGKLSMSIIARRSASLHSLVAGAGAMLRGDDAPFDGVIAEVLVSTPGQSIAGGTDEIQRNILGEKVLGLPREPSVDTAVPFRDVRRNL